MASQARFHEHDDGRLLLDNAATGVRVTGATPGPIASRVYIAPTIAPQTQPLAAQTLSFHQRLPAYEESPLREAPSIAAALGLERIWIKDESSRFGLPAYKALGAGYAAHQALGRWLGIADPLAVSLETMRAAAARGNPLLVAPSDGNHGHAVARYAAMVEARSVILLPHGTASSRVEAINREPGAQAIVVEVSYLGAVAEAVALSERDDTAILVTDFDGAGTGPTPAWVVDGYSTIFAELDQQLARAQARRPSAIVVQVGAGALACAVARWAASGQPASTPLLCVEPATAACLLASLACDRVESVSGPFDSVMAGLNCDAPSALAFRELRGSVTAGIAIEDAATAWAMQALAREGVESGESGAAGLAGLAVTMLDPALASVRAACRLDDEAEVLVFVTERITDPVSAATSLGMTCDGWPVIAPGVGESVGATQP
jgi:diaminopropionate ammonia-lyase